MKKGRCVTEEEITGRRQQQVGYLVENCNRCQPTIRCKGANTKPIACLFYIKPYDKFPLIELALEHPQSLADTFTALLVKGIKMRVDQYV